MKTWGLVFMLMLGGYVFAQYPHCPKFIVHKWNSALDFENAKDSVKHLCKWLNETPFSWEYEQRTKANLYVLSWLTEHPTKKWNWNTACFGPLEDHLDLMYAFLHASLYYSLTRENASEIQREVFVLQSMSKKIEQSKKYDAQDEWKPLVKAVRKKREIQYFEECRGNKSK